MPEIYELLQSRQPDGVEQLLRACGPLLRYVIRPILPNEQDMEDCVQEVLLLVWEKIDLFDPGKGSFTAWLTALTRNAALNRLRRGTVHEERLDPVSFYGESGPEEELLRREQRRELKTALEQLPPKEKLLIYRKYYYRQSTGQIAAEMGMTERAVEGKLYRAKKRLRTLLGGDDRG